MSRPVWRRSSSDTDAIGVEVAVVDGVVTVRDAKDLYGAVLLFMPEEWARFTAGVRAGEFDLETLAARSAGDGSDGDGRPCAHSTPLAAP